MKKIVWILVAVLLFISACADSKAVSEKESTNQENEQEQTETDKQKEEEQKSADKTVKAEEEKQEETEIEQVIEAKYKINEETSSVVPLKESYNEKVILLTIDDAPDKYALEMAKTLKSLDAGAIFFVNGHFLDTPEEKEVLKQIHEMGFPIGNHTYNHAFLPDLSEEKQKKEIISLSDTIEEIIGKRPEFFRAPNGANTDFTKQTAKEEGMVLMNWTYGYDYFEPYMDAKKLTEAMVTGKGPEVDVPYSLLKPGANLLMHDREWTAKALKDIVTGLRNKGYEIVDPNLIQKIK
ncbi:polysaccharide deacetylase family protein [Virgibacillus doumboii]|uniref:polysaccharide deacetylase family protein n=1 Tax=Virgibacillus doumboii TaxID=2697503 RepID=UPI0013DF2447|nr:polysaccharide deacetylase family protein [Virgibacillus doumboii]